MASFWKVVGIVVGSVVVLGVVVGCITWAVLASKLANGQGQTPPVLKDLDWWEHTVVYQIYPRSFKDSNGDGIGDLNGITSKLEHFVDIGVGAIWLSPIFSSPMVDFGYDISDFYTVHSEYGTMADFEALVQRAHELGVKVLLDMVPNHASSESEYFKKSVAREAGYEDFFVWADAKPDPTNSTNGTVPSNWISQFGGSIWEWNDVREQYYLHQFAVAQVDFNYRNSAVRAEILNIMRHWFAKGVDGYRLDAMPHLFEADPSKWGGVYPDEPLTGNMFLNSSQVGYTTEEFIKNQIELYDVLYEWRDMTIQWTEQNHTDTKILLAEAYCNITMSMLYYTNERGRLGAHFPFNFDFITAVNAKSNARDYVYTIKRWLTYLPAGMSANWVFGNHDNNRVTTRYGTALVDGLNSMSMLLPGVAITYQGEEIGMNDGYVSWADTVDVNACNQGNPDNYHQYSRDPERTPYQWDSTTSAGFSTNASTWLPVGQDYTTVNLAAQKTAARSHYKVYKALLTLRKEPTLSHGDYYLEALTEYTFVLVRHLVTYDTYGLLFNVGQAADSVDLNEVPLLKEPLTVYTSSIQSSRVVDDTIALGNITLQAGEAIVFKTAKT